MNRPGFISNQVQKYLSTTIMALIRYLRPSPTDLISSDGASDASVTQHLQVCHRNQSHRGIRCDPLIQHPNLWIYVNPGFDLFGADLRRAQGAQWRRQLWVAQNVRGPCTVVIVSYIENRRYRSRERPLQLKLEQRKTYWNSPSRLGGVAFWQPSVLILKTVTVFCVTAGHISF